MNADSYNHSLDDLKCIWMTSGLVAYKLCSLEFDCDNCEFDKVFRKNSASLPGKNNAGDSKGFTPFDILINRIKDEHFDEKLIYLENQLVLKKIFGSAYYLGINPLVLPMLDNLNTVDFTQDNNIKKGKMILTICGSWGKKEFYSPIDFMLIEKFTAPAAAFNLNKWFAILISSDSAESRYNFDQWNSEKEKLIKCIKKSSSGGPEIGKTLMDGGEKIITADQVLGCEEYYQVLNSFFV